MKASTPKGVHFLDELGTALAENPPPARDRPLVHRLAGVGVGPGLAPERAGLAPGILSAVVAGVQQAAAALPTQGKLAVLNAARHHGGWFVPSSIIGNYGTDYLFRAETASLGLGANTPREAVYPMALTDAAGNLLSGDTTYAIGSSHPPLIRRGDGSVVVVVSRRRPAESGLNWLLSPPGSFRLNMRLYRPRASVLDGRWRPPPVQPVASG